MNPTKGQKQSQTIEKSLGLIIQQGSAHCKMTACVLCVRKAQLWFLSEMEIRMVRDDCRFRPGTNTTNHKDSIHLESRSRKLHLTDRRHHAVKTGKAYVDYSVLQGRISEQTRVCMCVCACVLGHLAI